jgi:bla regulator protein BlaR1
MAQSDMPYRSRIRKWTSAAGAFLTLAQLVNAQTPSPVPHTSLSFEVASVRRSAPDDKAPPITVSQGGGITAHVTLDTLIMMAYNVKPFQLSGLPRWAESEHYSIAAKPPADYRPKKPGVADEDLAQRIQNLLADRFGLVVHRESPQKPVYVLVVAKNGPKLKEADTSIPFRLRLGKGKISNDGGGKVAMLASVLSNQFDRPVVDETGLTGFYKFDLKWTPDAPLGTAPNPGASSGSGQPDAGGPSLFTALEEQLGLKLESKRRPVVTIVIDRLERPAEN